MISIHGTFLAYAWSVYVVPYNYSHAVAAWSRYWCLSGLGWGNLVLFGDPVRSTMSV